MRAHESREGGWAGECGRTSLYATHPDRQKFRGGGGEEREGMCPHSLATSPDTLHFAHLYVASHLPTEILHTSALHYF